MLRKLKAYISSSYRRQWVFLVVAGSVVLLSGIAGGAYFSRDNDRKECLSKYPHISPYIACFSQAGAPKENYDQLRRDIRSAIEKLKAGSVGEISFFFRDLRSNEFIGIDDLADFAPASLLKLPLAMAYFRMEEDTPGLLQKQLVYAGKGAMPIQTIVPFKKIEEGRPYSVRELLFNSLAYSDNASYEVLVQYLQNIPKGPENLLRAYQELGILNPKDAIEETMSVRGYASIFRILYSSAYLNFEDSETITSWLIAADYKEGLAAGVPSGLSIANKFGERSFFNKDGVVLGMKQLHDCGIVFYPGNPYVVCVMTRGGDMQKLTEVIAELSRIVYQAVDVRHR